MLAHYINLRAATDRRAALETQVKALPSGQWTLERFEALDATSETCLRAQGRISEREKACLLSHRTLLGQRLQVNTDAPFMIWEDDVFVGPTAHSAVERFLMQMPPGSWDILYTDLIVPDLTSMLALLTRRRRLRPQQGIEVLDLRDRSFAGASAYLVNPRSLRKIVDLLHGITALDEPVDLLLRRFIHQGSLQGHALFPFVTTVSDASMQSQIQPGSAAGTDLAWTLFRRLMWAECEVETLYPLCNRLSSLHPDPESSVMGVIMAAMISPHFKLK